MENNNNNSIIFWGANAPFSIIFFGANAPFSIIYLKPKVTLHYELLNISLLFLI